MYAGTNGGGLDTATRRLGYPERVSVLWILTGYVRTEYVLMR
jgi:hypothetical protein